MIKITQSKMLNLVKERLTLHSGKEANYWQLKEHILKIQKHHFRMVHDQRQSEKIIPYEIIVRHMQIY